MASELVGMHVLGKSFFIDIPKAVAFGVLLFTIVLTQCFDMANGLSHRAPPPLHAAPAAPLATATTTLVSAVGEASGSALCDIEQMGREERAALLAQLIQMVGR
jgi:hypothetical protein